MFGGLTLPGSSAGPTPPGPTSPPSAGDKAECDVRIEACYPEYTKRLGIGILKDKIEEYKAGKYTEKYMRTYLDFVHLEGIVDNLQYFDFKKQIEEI